VALAVAGRDRAGVRRVIEGFTAGAVPTLVLAHVVPNVWRGAGPAALVVLVAGYGVVWLFEHATERSAVGTPLALGALTIHAVLDGASLAMSRFARMGRASSLLAAVIVAHRVPEGLVVGGLCARRYGPKAAIAIGGTLAVLMACGAAGGRVVLDRVDAPGVDLVVAGGMGALLRVVLHDHDDLRWRRPGAVAAAAIGALVAWTVPELS
jgi:hypothetical protein